MNQLAEKLEVWGFEEGLLIYKDLSLGVVLKLSPKDISCVTDDLLNTLHGAIGNFLNGLPAKLNLQFVQEISKGASRILEAHQKGLKPEALEIVGNMLTERTQRLAAFDKAGAIPAQNIYLVIRKSFDRRGQRKKRFRFWEKKDEEQDWSREILTPELKSMNQIVETVQKGLEALGVQSLKLPEAETFDLLFEQWNPGHPLPGLNFNREDIRDELILNDVVVSIKGFSIAQHYHRVLSVKIMPEQTFSAMAEKLKELPFGSKLFLTIETLDQDKEDLALQTQRRVAYAMYSGKKGVSDLESKAKLEDIETLLQKRVSGEEKIFSAALNVVLRSTSESELEEQVQNVLEKIRALSGAEGMVESLAAASIFFDLALPNARAKERSRKMNTSVLADFLPLYGDWRGHAEARVLLRNRSGGVLGFNPFSPTHGNFNQIVSGGSGAGKSFANVLMVSHLMKEDPKVFIIDIGASYKRLSENLDGQYIGIGTDSSLSLNPFDLSDQSSEALDQKIKFMASLVELMTKEDDSTGIGKLERSEIEQTIKEIYREEKDPKLSHLRERLLKNNEPLLQRMGKILGTWCGDSPYGKFVDQKTNLSLKKNIVCFDLKGLESQPDLQAVCLFIIMDLIWREVQKDQTNMKIVIFDECWSLLENEAGSRFLGEVYRTFRKYRASAIAISQTMDDFANSKVASAILPNSSVKWILKQTGGNIPSLQKILRLNERETKLIESLTSKKGYFSEAFLISGDDRQIVKIESTPLEYWLATTDPLDLKAIEEMKQEHPELTGTHLLKNLSERFPRGASNP
ncbi:MAG TPA: ATP-binding protein [Pseudobdellovibrionaceae bacterium]|jgi:conjugal transfer ATP-binding protein TraC